MNEISDFRFLICDLPSAALKSKINNQI